MAITYKNGFLKKYTCSQYNNYFPFLDFLNTIIFFLMVQSFHNSIDHTTGIPYKKKKIGPHPPCNTGL